MHAIKSLRFYSCDNIHCENKMTNVSLLLCAALFEKSDRNLYEVVLSFRHWTYWTRFMVLRYW